VSYALVYLLLRRFIHLVAGSSNQLNSDLEVVILRHQLRVLRRQVGKPRPRHRDRLFMAAISRAASCSMVLLCGERADAPSLAPGTRAEEVDVQAHPGGRPAFPDEVRSLIVRMGREIPKWGCIRIRGELAKLGIRVSATKIRALLRRAGLGPAPRRGGPHWTEFVRSQAHAILAVDFFTVDTLLLQTP
jgi:putative transposase